MTDSATAKTSQNSTIGVYASDHEALHALTRLKDAGYSENTVSVVGKGVKEVNEVHGWVPQGNKAGHFGTWGAFWGALSGWLLLGFVWLPGIGWVAAAGWLASVLVGAGIGAGLGALTGLAVPDREIPGYESDLKADRYLVIVHGDVTSVERAHSLLEDAEPIRLNRYSV